MSTLIENILHADNLHWAWKKAKRAYQLGDVWFNEIEITHFEANLYTEFDKIRIEVNAKKFSLSPIRPVPFPKAFDDNKQESKTRQMFYISVRDQVLWLAVVNVIGGELDYLMPFWSYGNRLYISTWFEEIENMKKEIKHGWYRNSSGLIYRKWSQSWPLFRKHISVTSKIMANSKKYNLRKVEFQEENLDESEIDVLQNNEQNHIVKLQNQYLVPKYWPDTEVKELYWAGVDLEKFYPKIKLEVIEKNIIKYFLHDQQDEDFKYLISALLSFPLDIIDWTEEELKEVLISSDEKFFHNLPTGLHVAGFLANVALLEVDSLIFSELDKRKDIAHFRFVDDHIFISYSFESLVEWIKLYDDKLKEFDIGAVFSQEKIDPPEFAVYYKSQSDDDAKRKAKDATRIDPEFPSPLMTQTLAKVSAINSTEFDLLSISEENHFIADLEHLLLTDFPDHELRKDTRISFAATMLARIVPRKRYDFSEVYKKRKEIYTLIKNSGLKNKSLKSEIINSLLFDNFDRTSINSEAEKFKQKVNDDIINAIISNAVEIKLEEIVLTNAIENESFHFKQHIYSLLIKALRENYSKVRLLVRVMEFCYRTGFKKQIEIIKLIEEIRDAGKLSKLASSYLHSLCISIITENLLQSLSRIINKENYTPDQKSSIEYITYIFSDSNLKYLLTSSHNDNNKFFYREIYEIFKFSIGSIIFILKEEGYSDIIKESNKYVREYSLVDWENKKSVWLSDNKRTINDWLFWLLLKTNYKNNSLPNKYWYKLIRYINLSDASSIPLLLPFPNYELIKNIPETKTLISIIPSKINNEGWFFDFANTIKVKATRTKFLNKIGNDNLLKNINSSYKNHITLSEWLDYEIEYKNSEKSNIYYQFDPRFSEWSSIEIVLQIINALMAVINPPVEVLFGSKSPAPILSIHPSNFLLPKSWIDESANNLSWSDWQNKAKKKCIILRKKESRITDDRYTTLGLKSYQTDSTISYIHGLGLLLLNLLTFEKSIPWVWNIEDHGLVYNGLINERIEKAAISSRTYLILASCFSSRNRETFFWQNKKISITGFNFAIDTKKDPPLIRSIGDLKSYLESAQQNLVQYQISVQDNLPRQLIPFSLEVLADKNILMDLRELKD
jgi:hypothetical protein